MIRNVFLIGILSCLPSCVYLPYVEKQSYNISKIPVVPHQNPVEIFLQGEIPKDEHFKISSITVSSRYDSFDKMLVDAQQRAQGIGYDGIIVVDVTAKTGYTKPKESISYDQSRMAGTTGKDRQYYQDRINGRIADGSYQEKPYTYQELTVMGIKYKKNINYLDQFLKAEHYYTDSTQSQPVTTMHYSFDGTKTKTELVPNFTQQLNRFDPDFLIKSTSKWEYMETSGMVTNRRYKERDFSIKRCKLIYNDKPQPQIVKVLINESYPPKNEGHNYEMYINYTAKGAIQSIRVYTPKNKKLIETRIYHYENNKYVGKTIQIFHGAPKQYIVKAEYYTNDMVSELK